MSSLAEMTSRRAINEGSSPPSIIRANQYKARPDRSPNTFDESRYDVIVQFSTLIVCQRVLLKSFGYDGVRDNHLVRSVSLYHQFKNIQQLAGVSSAIPEHGIRFAKFDMFRFQYDISFHSLVQQSNRSSFVRFFKTYNWQRDKSGRMTSKDGFSVVAPISVTVPAPQPPRESLVGIC